VKDGAASVSLRSSFIAHQRPWRRTQGYCRQMTREGFCSRFDPVRSLETRQNHLWKRPALAVVVIERFQSPCRALRMCCERIYKRVRGATQEQKFESADRRFLLGRSGEVFPGFPDALDWEKMAESAVSTLKTTWIRELRTLPRFCARRGCRSPSSKT
jgi:hypothetical protein